MGIFPPTLLTNRSIIRASGADASSLLQGLLTCNVQTLKKDGDIAWGFLLTPQGRYLHELFVLRVGDEFLLDVYHGPGDAASRPHSPELAERCTMGESGGETGCVKDFLKRLKIYTLRSEAHFAVDESVAVLASPNPPLAFGGDIIVQDPRHEDMGHRIYGGKDALRTMAKVDDMAGYHAHRVQLAIPSAEDFIAEKTLLLDYDVNQLGGIDFAKGCYVGQEVTARMHYKAIDKKGLYAITSEDSMDHLRPYMPIYLGSAEAGTLLSISGTQAIGMLRHEYAMGELSVEGRHITAIRPRWIKREDNMDNNQGNTHA